MFKKGFSTFVHKPFVVCSIWAHQEKAIKTNKNEIGSELRTMHNCRNYLKSRSAVSSITIYHANHSFNSTNSIINSIIINANIIG